ncbi:MAG: hypothetical protein H6797_03880 [Candidatus Nomurabacteria bacterium]|nr:MAG: hypothetical protein H6797_03880 [Candidatus Nomurabacteria bacterium]
MTIAIQKGRAIVLALLMAIAMLFATGVSTSVLPRAHADNWTRIENYAWQGGNFACDAVRVIGPYWGAASYANWNLWRINDNKSWTRQDLSIVLALGAAQKCPEYFWIFAYQIPPEIAQRIAPPPPPAPAPPALP